MELKLSKKYKSGQKRKKAAKKEKKEVIEVEDDSDIEAEAACKEEPERRPSSLQLERRSSPLQLERRSSSLQLERRSSSLQLEPASSSSLILQPSLMPDWRPGQGLKPLPPRKLRKPLPVQGLKPLPGQGLKPLLKGEQSKGKSFKNNIAHINFGPFRPIFPPPPSRPRAPRSVPHRYIHVCTPQPPPTPPPPHLLPVNNQFDVNVRVAANSEIQGASGSRGREDVVEVVREAMSGIARDSQKRRREEVDNDDVAVPQPWWKRSSRPNRGGRGRKTGRGRLAIGANPSRSARSAIIEVERIS